MSLFSHCYVLAQTQSYPTLTVHSAHLNGIATGVYLRGSILFGDTDYLFDVHLGDDEFPHQHVFKLREAIYKALITDCENLHNFVLEVEAHDNLSVICAEAMKLLEVK